MREMATAVFLVTMSLLHACGASDGDGSATTGASGDTPVTVTTPDDTPEATLTPIASGDVPPTDPDYFSDAELAARGVVARATLAGSADPAPDGIPAPDDALATSHDYLCGPGAEASRCVCRAPLACTASGDCITLEQNLDGFRRALASTGERRVHCERAEVGQCGAFRYFYFEGDIHRYEMRWFDASGRLVAQRNSTDYPEYCDHSAMTQWMGRVPKCDALVRDELLCGDADRPLRTPFEDIAAYTTPRP